VVSTGQDDARRKGASGMNLRVNRRIFFQTATVGLVGTGQRAYAGDHPTGRALAGSDTPSGPVSCDGFCDLQVNGFAGIDFNDPAVAPDQVSQAVAAMERTGVTRFLATLISAPLDRFAACARVLADHQAPALAGLHMEGPYISPQDGARGAHRKEDVSDASLDDFARRQEAARGRIRLVTVAPEVPGVLPLVERLTRDGVLVSIGHTAASPEQIRAAISAGARLSTHLGNGCAQMLPRHPNVIWEQLAADELVAGLIVDGHHLPPSTVKAMVRAKTASRVVLVTDATTAAGQPPGDYMLGSVRVHLDAAGRVAVPGQPNLAGSALSLDRAVGNTIRFTGLPLAEVLPMATTHPAAILGLSPRGRIEATWDSGSCTFTVNRVTT
jgi:N-acetylglucosamine-6-phosphate deacetylase